MAQTQRAKSNGGVVRTLGYTRAVNKPANQVTCPGSLAPAIKRRTQVMPVLQTTGTWGLRTHDFLGTLRPCRWLWCKGQGRGGILWACTCTRPCVHAHKAMTQSFSSTLSHQGSPAGIVCWGEARQSGRPGDEMHCKIHGGRSMPEAVVNTTGKPDNAEGPPEDRRRLGSRRRPEA